MNIGAFKRICRTRAGGTGVFTNNYLADMIIYLLADLALTVKCFRTYTDISVVTGTYEYEISQTMVTINRIEHGTDTDALVPFSYDDFKIIWKTNGSSQVHVPYIQIKAPVDGETVRVWHNDLNQINSIDLTDDTATFDAIFNPLLQVAIIDGIVGFYKAEYEHNPAGNIAMQLWTDKKQEIAASYRAGVYKI